MNVGAILAGMGINVVVGQPVIGVFSALYSTNIGGYKDTESIEGHRYNPGDGKWYLTSPAPFFISSPCSGTNGRLSLVVLPSVLRLTGP